MLAARLGPGEREHGPSSRIERSVIGVTTRITSSAPASDISCRPCAMRSADPSSGGMSSTIGRPPASRSSTTRTHALRSIVGGFAARALARRRRSAALRDANPSGVLPYQIEPRVPRVDMGERDRQDPLARRCRPSAAARRAGVGKSTASCTWWYTPSNVTRSPARSRRTISKASSNRDARWSNGTPNASNSVRFHPAPMPKTSRPPLTSSTVAAIFARIAGGWNPAQATSGPSRTRCVTAASPASSVHASHGPRSGRPSSR